MGTARAPVFGSGRCPACSCRVSNPNSRASSARMGLSVTKALSSTSPACPAFGQEAADDRGLPRLLKQEAVVAVRRLDHMEVDRLAESAKCLFNLGRRGWWVQPIGAERDQQRPRRNAFERPHE